MKKLAIAAMLIVGAALQQAHAGLLELRGGVGLNAANPHSFEDRVNNISGKDLSADNFDNFNADIFFNLPVIPIGVGLRQEWLSQKQSSGGDEWKLDAQNTSVLIDWRILNNVVYLGPIVGIGYPTAKLHVNSSSVNGSNSIKSGQPSYSAGLEAGVKLGTFLVGAEAGYSSIKYDKSSSDNSNLQTKVDLSGFYGKLMVGLSLF